MLKQICARKLCARAGYPVIIVRTDDVKQIIDCVLITTGAETSTLIYRKIKDKIGDLCNYKVAETMPRELPHSCYGWVIREARKKPAVQENLGGAKTTSSSPTSSILQQ